MMSHDQYLSQVRSTDLAQLEESDVSPMILRSLVAGRSFARLPFLCPPHPMVQTHTKEKMFLHGILDTKGVTKMGHATACMDLPCEWAQFLYTCAERGLEDSALVLIATWHREGPAMTQQFNVNHGFPDGSLCHHPTAIIALNHPRRHELCELLDSNSRRVAGREGLVHRQSLGRPILQRCLPGSVCFRWVSTCTCHSTDLSRDNTHPAPPLDSQVTMKTLDPCAWRYVLTQDDLASFRLKA